MPSSYSSQPVESWNTEVGIHQYGAHFYQRVGTALYGLWLFVIFGVAVWAAFARKSRSAAAHSIFKVYKFWLAIVLAILCYAFTFSFRLVQQHYSQVTEAYLLVQIIFTNFIYPAEICLLATIFDLLFQLSQQSNSHSVQHRVILWLHYAVCIVLFVLYITIFGLQARELYTRVFDGEPTIYGVVNGSLAVCVLDVVFDAIYAWASLEVVITSIVIMLFKARSNPQKRSTPVLLLTLVAIPLFIFSLFILGTNAAIEFGAVGYDIVGLSLAQIVILGLGLVLAFVGLVAIGMQAEHSDVHHDIEHRGMQLGQFGPTSGESHSQGLDDKEPPVAVESARVGSKDRITAWRASFRKGWETNLGLKTAF